MTLEREIKLVNCKNINEFLAMFFGLGMKDKLSVFTEEIAIDKDTEFYRIRRAQGISNPDNPIEWGPVPSQYAKQGRFNAKGESILYLASESDCLEREVKLKKGEEYYLAKYVCKNSFSVGSFLGTNNQVNTLIHKIAMAITGPDELNEKENALVEKYLKIRTDTSLNKLSLDMLASLYIYKSIPNLYDVTNKLAKLVLRINENGIRYSSVYVPMELSGTPVMITLDGVKYGNYALTQKGYENIEFVSAEKKICSSDGGGLELLIESFTKAELDEMNKDNSNG